jgi:hypothetical protein
VNTDDKVIFGALLIIILTSIIYVSYDNKVKFRIDEDKTTLYVKENSRWVVAGREYNKLFDGTSRMNRDKGSISVTSWYRDGYFYVQRSTKYIRGPQVVDTYMYDPNTTSVEKFPLEHRVDVFDGEGYIYQYEVRDLVYNGPTYATEDHYFAFGRGVKIEILSDAYWTKVYTSGILKSRFRLQDNHETFYVRLFDPVVLYLQGSTGDQEYELGTPIQARVTHTADTAVCIDVLDALYGVNYSCGTTDGSGDYYANLSLPTVSIDQFNDSTFSKSITESSLGYIRTSNTDDYQEFSFDISGTGSENNTVDVCNDGTIDYYLPGSLNSNSLQSKEFTDNRSNVTFTSLNSAVLKYIEIPDLLGTQRNFTLNITPTIYFFLYTEDFTTTEFKDEANTDAVWNITSNKGHMIRNLYGQTIVQLAQRTAGNGELLPTLEFAENPYDASNTTFSVFSGERNAYICGTDRAAEYTYQIKIYNITENVTVDLKYHLFVQITDGVVDKDTLVNRLQVYDFDTPSWTQLDVVSCNSGPCTSQTSNPKTLSFTIDPKYVNDADQNSMVFRSFWQETCETVLTKTMNATTRLYDGFAGIESKDVYYNGTTSDQLQTLQSSTLYTPDENIISFRVNISSEETSDANFTFYLAADGSSFEIISPHNTLVNHTFSTQGKDLRWKAEFFTLNRSVTSNITLIEFPDAIGTTYPSNVKIDIGNDGTNEYINTTNMTKNVFLDLSENASTSIINFLNGCTDNICLLPILYSSATRGVLETVPNLTTSLIGDLNTSATCFACTTAACDKGINVSPGAATVSDLKLSYYGHKNVTIRGHDSSNSTKYDSVASLYYSGWNYSFKPGVSYIEFIPKKGPTEKNVGAWGQSDNEGILNFTTRNHDRNMNFSILINETSDCVDFFVGTSSNKSTAINLSATPNVWQPLFTNKALGYVQEVWMWEDFSCNNTQWTVFTPGIYLRGCALNTICSGDTV